MVKINTVRQSVAMYLSDVMPISLLQLQWAMMYLSLQVQRLPKMFQAGALAIARSRQVNKEDYASKLPSAQKTKIFPKIFS